MKNIDYFKHATSNKYLVNNLLKHSNFESALKTIDHMYLDQAITKAKHKTLTEMIYKKFEKKHNENNLFDMTNLAKIAASVFLVFGIFFSLGQTEITGNAVNIGSEFSGGTFIGISLVFVSFLLLFILNKKF